MVNIIYLNLFPFNFPKTDVNISDSILVGKFAKNHFPLCITVYSIVYVIPNVGLNILNLPKGYISKWLD